MKIYTVSNLEEVFGSIEEARTAWEAAGKPKQRGNSVWITESEVTDGIAETIHTVTIASA